MQRALHSVPTRKSAAGDQIETRPQYVEEWLDSLPYIDFQKTSRILLDAVRATNQQHIKPSVRLELIRLYNRPYQYYLDSQVRVGAQHTLQSIETMQGQVNTLKHIAMALWNASKIAIENDLNQKTLWRQSKPPLPAMLMSLGFLSHALIFSFLEYSPTPKNIWRELNFIFDFANRLGQANISPPAAGGDPKKDVTTIANEYKRIILASLVDPHALPFGAIWEIFEQLRDWSTHAEIINFKTIENQAGHFVIVPDSDSPPVPYAKFNSSRAENRHRLIDATALAGLIKRHIDRLEWEQGLNSSVLFSPYYARTILTQMSKAYGLPPQRDFPRIKKTGSLRLALGINTVYFHLNGQNEFSPPRHRHDDRDMHDETDIDIGSVGINSSPGKIPDYLTEEWKLIDHCPGGFSAIKDSKPGTTIRVGDMVGFSSGNGQHGETWALGVIRWLTVIQNKIYKIGIQRIAGRFQPAAIRGTSGSVLDKTLRRAMITEDLTTIVTGKGLYEFYRELEVIYKDKTFTANADSLHGASISYEHFTITT